MTLNEKFHEFVKESNPNLDKYWEDVFKKMAEYVFQNCHLEANGEKYYLTEIEFYYYSENNKHPDPWCYRQPNKNKDFLPSDALWFHYSGMDITFDNEGNDEYGGILIRSIKDKDGNQTNGPLRSLYKLLNASANGKSVCLNLKLTQSNISVSMAEPIPRYGLNVQTGDKNFSEKNKYQAREYRFYLEGTDIKKNK